MAGQIFDRVFVIMLENEAQQVVLANPYMRALAGHGMLLSAHQGVHHPSQPNYIATLGGSTLGINDDSTPQHARFGGYYDEGGPVTNLVDLLESRGKSWKAYMEDLPGTDGRPGLKTDPTPPSFERLVKMKPPEITALWAENADKWATEVKRDYPYQRKHNPFVSFANIAENSARLANVVSASTFESDLSNGRLADFCWYTPNMHHCGHDLFANQEPIGDGRAQRVQNSAEFLQRLLGDEPVARFPANTLIVITYDESWPYSGPWSIYTVLMGDMIRPGSRSGQPSNHYGLLRTIEDNFGLGSLERHDAAAEPFRFLWGQS